MRASRYLSCPIAVVVLAAGAGCGKSVARVPDLTPSSPSGADANASSWRMVVLSGPSQFTVAPPAPVTSAAYQAELASIKAAQASLTDAQRAAIDYWSAGGVIRWNEIMLELATRADLPPAPRPDGTYPAPDPENPFADPQFPFSNPPYASRAYSYVTVAQFEALKVAWHYVNLYGRPAPSAVDSSIQALMPATGVPAYPSADAVLSGVTAELLKLLFPTSVDEITEKAAEQRNAALWSGRAAASDISAGLALGKAVAPVFAARAASDGMKNAAGSPALVQGLSNATAARGETPWKSQESPPRPPMLPAFGQVRAWMMTPIDIANERPGPPPSTSSAQMQQELAEVKNAVEHATREQLATVYNWNDGANTYTPPGHWNFIAAQYIHDAHWSEVRSARAFALLNMALHDAAVACWDVKYTYFNPRPSQLDPSIKTVIGLPNFPSYTSGHSTFSAAAAVVLGYLFPGDADTFNAERDEAALSRLYAGIHYPSDINVGKEHGTRIGGYTVAFAREDGAD
jgi:hypothetical protein